MSQLPKLVFEDIQHLILVLQKIGRSLAIMVFIINLNLDVKVADYVLDLGPDGGKIIRRQHC